MRRSLTLLAASLLALTGCADDPVVTPNCVESSARIMFPSPLWFDGTHLQGPGGDAAFAVLEESRPQWVGELSAMNGFARLPDLVVPLTAAGAAIDTNGLHAYSNATGEWVEQVVGFEARLEDEPPALIVRPLEPLAPGGTEAIVAIDPGAVQGASVRGICQGDMLHPDLEAAAEELPGAPELAVRLPLSSASEVLPRLGTRLGVSPVLEVKSAEARTADSFGDKSPPADTAASLGPIASGILTLPDYRTAAGFVVDADGVPEAQGVTEPGFVVMLPATGTAPYPFVLFQHGGGQDKADALALSKPLADAGFAIVAIDLPVHGDRGPEGGGGDLDFLNFDSALETRGNFRQAVADHMAVLTGIAALNTALEAPLGVAAALDASRGFYMGLSLGGISGSMTFTSAPALRGAALFVAGAGYADLVQQGVFGVLFNDVRSREAAESATVFSILGTLLDGADPASHAIHAERRDAPPRPALFMQAVGDPIVASSPNDRLARAFGASLAQPFDHEVDGMEAIALPAKDNFTWPGGNDRATRVQVHNPMAAVASGDKHAALITLPYAQEMVAHCFTTILEGGSCEVIDTGFAAQ